MESFYKILYTFVLSFYFQIYFYLRLFRDYFINTMGDKLLYNFDAKFHS